MNDEKFSLVSQQIKRGSDSNNGKTNDKRTKTGYNRAANLRKKSDRDKDGEYIDLCRR